MTTTIIEPQATLIKARQLLTADPKRHDAAWCQAWCTDVQTALAEINAHIATAAQALEHTTAPDLRQQTTNLIGLLITERQRLERVLQPVQGKPPSLLAKLKSTFGLDDTA